MRIITLPRTVYDFNAGDFLTALVTPSDERGPISVDFKATTFLVPIATVGLLAAVKRWHSQGRAVFFTNCLECACFAYLQRMNLFQEAGILIPEAFERHQSTQFVELKCIDTTLGNVGPLSTSIAACAFPSLADSDDPEITGPFDVVEYASSELILNVQQHSRGVGYVSAQVYPSSGLVRIAIADSGMGIRQSFEETHPPGWHSSYDDLDALTFALKPRVSSKMHLQASSYGNAQTNAGVGLSILKELAKLTDGIFTLASGNGFHQENHNQFSPFSPLITKHRLPNPFLGTLCSLELSQKKLLNHQEMLMNAKVSLGLMNRNSAEELGGFFT